MRTVKNGILLNQFHFVSVYSFRLEPARNVVESRFYG